MSNTNSSSKILPPPASLEFPGLDKLFIDENESTHLNGIYQALFKKELEAKTFTEKSQKPQVKKLKPTLRSSRKLHKNFTNQRHLLNLTSPDKDLTNLKSVHSQNFIVSCFQALREKIYLAKSLLISIPKFYWQKQFQPGPWKNQQNESIKSLLHYRLFIKNLFNQGLPKNIGMKEIPSTILFDNSIAKSQASCYEFVDSEFKNLSLEKKLEYFTVFYYHGGGTVYCHPQHEYRRYLGQLVKLVNTYTHNERNLQKNTPKIRIIAVDYRLSPEIKGKIVGDDCTETTWKFIQQHHKFNINLDKVILAGNSGGGFFTGVVLTRLLQRGCLGPRPRLDSELQTENRDSESSSNSKILKFSPFAVLFSCPVFPNYVTYDLPSFHNHYGDLHAEDSINYSMMAGLDFHTTTFLKQLKIT